MISISATMGHWPLMALVGALVCLALTSEKTGPIHGKVVVCYMGAWAVHRPGNFDPNLCTHVIYAFAGLDIIQDAIKSLDPSHDLNEKNGKRGFERINALKKTHPHLKVSLAIGGWDEGSKKYSILVADPNRRQRFVQQVSSFIRKHNFDGLDLVWMYPTQRGGEAKDRDTFVLLAKELRENFNKYNLLLTSIINPKKLLIDQAYNIRELAKYLDFLHVLCFDYHSSWDKKVGPSAPLEYDGFSSVRFTIEYIMQLGCPASKIVMGVAFNGRTFITALDGKFGDSTNGVDFQGPYSKRNGFLGYNEICPLLSNKTSGWTKSWDGKTSQPIARFRDQNVTKVISYDSTRSIANKVRFAMQKNLAGALVWSVDTDDFLGECEPETDTFKEYGTMQGVKLAIPRRINSNYPLLRTVNEGIILALDEINQQNVIAKGSHSGALNAAAIALSTILGTYSFVSFVV